MYAENALFIIRTMNESGKNRSDISHVSRYPDEQEVLLVPFIMYWIEKIEHEPVSGKSLIYITTVV